MPLTFDRACSWLLYTSIVFTLFGVVVAVAPNFPPLAVWTSAVNSHSSYPWAM